MMGEGEDEQTTLLQYCVPPMALQQQKIYIPPAPPFNFCSKSAEKEEVTQEDYKTPKV